MIRIPGRRWSSIQRVASDVRCALNVTEIDNGRDGLELIVWARNLLDADYIQNLTIQAGNSGLIVGTQSDPRTIGGTIRFRM